MDDHQKTYYNWLYAAFRDSEVITIAKGAGIFSPESSSKYIYFVERGAVKVYNFFKGKVFIKYFFFENDIFGLEGLLESEHYLNFAEAISFCRLRRIEVNKIKKEVLETPESARGILQLLEEQEHLLFRRFYEKSANTSEEIIFGFLEYLGAKTGVLTDGTVRIPFIPLQGDIATYLGVSRQNVSTAFAKLRKKKVIKYNRAEFVINNPEGKIDRRLLK